MRITGPVKLDDAAVGPEAETGAGGRGGAAAVKFYRHLQSYMAKHGYPIAKYRFIGLWGELEGPEWHGMIGCEIEVGSSCFVLPAGLQTIFLLSPTLCRVFAP